MTSRFQISLRNGRYRVRFPGRGTTIWAGTLEEAVADANAFLKAIYEG